MSRMTIVSFGDHGPSMALPFFPDDMLCQLMRTPIYWRDYVRGPDGEYSSVYVRVPIVVKFDELNVFDGTAEEYRKQPAPEKTKADLVADLSAANDQLAEATTVIADLKFQLYGPANQAEAAE